MKPIYHVSVRELVELVERSGDINFRFSTRSNAMDGIRGHQKLQKSRGGNYEAEKQVNDLIETPELTLEINGRVDGYYPDVDHFVVEEIKTIRVDVQVIPEPVKRLHLSQAKVYAYILAREHVATNVVVRMAYFDLDRNEEIQIDETFSFAELTEFYTTITGHYLHHLKQLQIWKGQRDEAILKLEFPYSEYRAGQREMAVSVYKALKSEGQLVMQAPTGIGKTIASIFPAVKSIQDLNYEKVFFLSAKTSGQHMAQKAVQDLKAEGLIFRDITITAKDKVCFNPGSACDAEQCEYAVGYYDKLPRVIEETLKTNTSLNREIIDSLAKENMICPFELALDLSLIADLVICDYNYVFDPVVHLRRYFEKQHSRYALLMDESHNLVDRGRDMFSAEFCKDKVLALRKLLKPALPLVAKRLSRINTEYLAVLKPFKEQFKKQGSLRLSACPEKLLQAVRLFTEAAEDWLQLNESSFFQSDLLDLYFEALGLIRTVEAADDGYAYLMLKRNGDLWFKAYCINPGPRLAEGFNRVSASVCFSATLTPQPYFQTLMGIQEEADWYQIESPFSKENLGVYTTGYIATTYKNRAQSLYDLVDTIHSVIQTKPGNYLVFFPSHAYLAEVMQKFTERYSSVRAIVQSPYMGEIEREQFLEAFNEGSGDSLLGFAVMGGIFGEGVDLKGSRLIGAIIVGVGLPQLGLERDLIKDYFNHEKGDSGFEFAYQYPGMNRVLQTAGRVIRSESDRGIVCLIDHRFNEARYRSLFPRHWQPELAKNRLQLEQYLHSFWRRDEKLSPD